MPIYKVLEDCFESNEGVFLEAGTELEIPDGNHSLDVLKGRMELIGGDPGLDPVTEAGSAPTPLATPLSDYDWENQHGRAALLEACKALNIEGIDSRSKKPEMAAALAGMFASPNSMPPGVADKLLAKED